jgi:DNA-binding NarL/FixJ family response regulator
MGYVTKQEPTDTIIAAIRRILAGEMYLPERMATQLVGLLIRGPKIATGALIASLSDRELEIFQMLGGGLNTRQIADNLNLDVKTVETYRARLKDKLQLETGSELVRLALNWVQNNSKP